MLRPMIAAAALATAIAAPAAAVPLLFTISGDYSASFTLDSNPTSAYYSTGFDTEFHNVAGTFQGGHPTENIEFYAEDTGGGVEIYDPTYGGYLMAGEGEQVYGGTEHFPTFAPGVFEMTDLFGSDATYTLTITQPAAPAPEPAGWATLALGVGMAGGVLRRRARVFHLTTA